MCVSKCSLKRHTHDTLFFLFFAQFTTWCCDVNTKATALTLDLDVALPSRLALVMGHESTGVSREMLDFSDRHVYLPIFGFGSSINLSVATALIVQRVFDLYPQLRGSMPPAERCQLRQEWYNNFASGNAQREAIARQLASMPDGTVPPLRDLRRDNREVRLAAGGVVC